MLNRTAVVVAALTGIAGVAPAANANNAVREATINTLETVGGERFAYTARAEQVVAGSLLAPTVVGACTFERLTGPSPGTLVSQCFIEDIDTGARTRIEATEEFGEHHAGAQGSDTLGGKLRLCIWIQVEVTKPTRVDGPIRCEAVT